MIFNISAELLHYGYQQLAFGVHRPYIFLFKVHLNAFVLQITNGGKAIHGITGKSAYALGYNEVDLAVQGIGYHSVKSVTLFGIECGDTFVGIDFNKLPLGTAFDVFGVIIHLCFIA